ncbi:MAG: hypothetical protein M3Y56_01190, partial [Armatimonadota bacterium]|nr:hypothetical protein [Armatimonadota bacterium]
SHTHQSQGVGFTKISSPEGVVDYAAPRGSTPAEATTVIIGARDATSGCAMIRFDKWPDAPVTLQLERGVTLTGSVVDKDGKPAAGVKVQVRPAMAAAVPATPPAIIQLGEPANHTTLRRLVTGPMWPAVEEDNAMQEGSPCFYQGSIRTTSDKDGHFEIPFLFSGCHVMVTFAVPGEGLKYQMVTLGGARMELRLGSEHTLWLPAPYQVDVRQALHIPVCY